MVEPKKHHYVPRSILKRFSIREEGRQVHVLDKATRRTYVAGVNDAGSENHFYSVEIGDQRQVMEHLFNDIDDEGAKLLDKICRDKSLRRLSTRERTVLCEVAAAQLLRVKRMRNDLVEVSRQLLSLMKKYGVSDGAELDAHVMSDSQARKSSIEYLAELPSFAGPFLEKDLLLISSGGGPFFIGDNPIVLSNSFPYGELALSSPGVEIYFPISKHLVIGFYCRSIRNHLERFEARGERRYQFLLDGIRSDDPVEFAPKRVDSLNQLQVRRSTQHLYSSEPDFSLAMAMLDTDPELVRGKASVQMGWEVYTHRESMPMGTFVVAVGQASHYMIPAEIVDKKSSDCELEFRTPIPEMVRDAISDSPFQEITLFIDKRMRRQIRDVVFFIRDDGVVCVRMRDEGLHRLFRSIDDNNRRSAKAERTKESEDRSPNAPSEEPVKRFSRETLQDFVAAGRQLVAEGKLPESELEELNEIEDNLSDATQEEWDTYSYFFENFNHRASDPASLVESGDLLVQERVQEFIRARLPNPVSLDSADFTEDHCIALGEALCLNGPEPARLWRRIRRLHGLRVSMASGLKIEASASLAEEFLADFENKRNEGEPEEVWERLSWGISVLYGELCGLISLARGGSSGDAPPDTGCDNEDGSLPPEVREPDAG